MLAQDDGQVEGANDQLRLTVNKPAERLGCFFEFTLNQARGFRGETSRTRDSTMS